MYFPAATVTGSEIHSAASVRRTASCLNVRRIKGAQSGRALQPAASQNPARPLSAAQAAGRKVSGCHCHQLLLLRKGKPAPVVALPWLNHHGYIMPADMVMESASVVKPPATQGHVDRRHDLQSQRRVRRSIARFSTAGGTVFAAAMRLPPCGVSRISRGSGRYPRNRFSICS